MRHAPTMSTPHRIRIIMVGIFVLGALLLLRLYFVQVAHHDYYVDRATRQYVHTSENVFDRGTIYFSTKDSEKVGAASMKSGYLMALNPTMVKNPDMLYASLTPHLTISKDDFLKKATLANRTYVEIEAQLPEDAVEPIKAMKLPGVSLYANRWRYYPGHDVSARSIGFIGYTDDGTVQRGKYGLEQSFDDVLYRDNTSLSVNFFAEIFSNLGEMVFDKQTQKSGDVVTTIEPTVARMLDRVLADTQDKYHSTLTGGIIMDPKTGEIYALDVVPTYDPNKREGVSLDLFQNPLVESVYEMGSIIKPLTMASGIDAGVVTPASTYFDAGHLELNTFTIHNYDGKGRGTVNMQEVLNQSLNTGVAHVVKLLGHDRFREYFTNLKLGSETGIDLPHEARGLVNNLESPREVEYATASFGQGIAMSPMETIRALATLGNGGVLVTPHIVKEVEFSDGTKKTVQFPPGAQVFKPETSETMSRMLATVVDKALRHGAVALPHHTVAAKTGTAQIAQPTGGYYDDRYLHSFFGYFPAYDPKFIIFLYTVEPKGVQYASETLTEPFMDLTKFLINYYNIPPDR
jgi:stage V sporulation protein D (sporulation-specific penicillin-binding protein)